MIKLGIDYGVLESAREAIELAQVAEDAGFCCFGVPDSPFLYAELYPVVTACLGATSSIRVGPTVTNPVSRNWSVHAAAVRTFHELHRGRFFLGIATGDGAVHSVGLRPASPLALEEAVRAIRGRAPADLEVQVAASGPRTLAVAGRVADGAIIGTGLDPLAFQTLGDGAEQGAARQREHGLERWAHVQLNVVEREEDVEAARSRFEPIGVAYGRFAFAASFEGKNVPEPMQAIMRERYPRYRFEHHAALQADNPNAALFADEPSILDYLVNRFCVVGTREQCAERIAGFASETQVDGVWFSVARPDPVGIVRRAGEAFAGLMRE